MKRRTLLSLPGISLLRAAELSRSNLLLYRATDGEVRRVISVRDWLRRRDDIIAKMQLVMGPLPGPERRGPLEVRIEEETDTGSLLRRLITYTAEPGSRVPAYLLAPKKVLEGGRRAAAVLCLHPTDNVLGHKVVVGLGGRANRQYAMELAERGYVTIAPAYPLLANYQPDLKALGHISGTMKAIHDNIRALDVLETLPYVRKGAFGAIGHSLGGHNAVYTAVFEPRIKAVVSSCGLDSYLDYKNGDIRGWTSERYMPKLLEYRERLQDIPFDFHEMIAALAPRVCYLSAPFGDDNFKWASVGRIAAAARQVYQLYGKPDHLIVQHPDCGHDFPIEARSFAYDLMSRTL